MELPKNDLLHLDASNSSYSKQMFIQTVRLILCQSHRILLETVIIGSEQRKKSLNVPLRQFPVYYTAQRI